MRDRAVIYDLDIGNDPDDTCVASIITRAPHRFRPALLLTNDETASCGRARFLAHLVAIAGTAIPVAAGLPSDRRRRDCLVERAGMVPSNVAFEPDGIAVLERTIDAAEAVTYFGLGALTNLATLLARRPDLARRIELVQMGPSLLGHREARRPQYNARLDPTCFRDVLQTLDRPRLLASHTSWERYPLGRQAFGLYRDDPLALAMRDSAEPVARAVFAHLEAWVGTGKPCSIMHDPLTVLAHLEAGLVDWIELELEIAPDGTAALTPASIEILRALPPSRTRAVAEALSPMALPDATTCRALVSLSADGDRARASMSLALLGEDLAAAWRSYNEPRAP